MSTTKGSNRSASNGAGMRAAGVPDFAAMTLGGERSLKAMATAHSRMIGRMARMNRACADFLERRLEHDRQTVMELADCRSPQEVAGVWTRFASTAAAQYAENFGAVASLAAEQGHEALADMRGEIEAAVQPFEGGAPHA
ncbi:MAG: phasin family protein [Pseudomonadota bacterium]